MEFIKNNDKIGIENYKNIFYSIKLLFMLASENKNYFSTIENQEINILISTLYICKENLILNENINENTKIFIELVRLLFSLNLFSLEKSGYFN